MRTNKELTLNRVSVSSPHRFVETVKIFLNAKNQLLSELTESEFTNVHAVALSLGAICAALSLVLALDPIAAYGWAAFLALAAFNLFIPVVRQLLQEGGAR